MLGLGIGNYNEVWVPTDIANCLLWLTTANGDNQMTFSSGTKMNKWGDLSGNDNHASQSTAGKAPDFTAATQSVDFDNTGSASVDDYMDLTTQISLDTSATGWSIGVLYTSVNWDGSAQCIVGDKDNSNNFIRHNSGESKFLIKVGGNNNIITLDNPADLVDNLFYSVIISCGTDGALTLYIDGTAQEDTENCSTNDITIDQIFARNNVTTLGGKVKELVIYRKAMDAQNITDLNGYFSGRKFDVQNLL